MLKFMEKMMGFMMDRTSQEEKQAMMAEMMERFFADMTAEDKQHMMEAMMPRMMEGMNMLDMMPKMMMGMMGEGKEAYCLPEITEGEQGKGISGMPQMMMHMMPHCLQMMLPHVAKDRRKGCKRLIENAIFSGIIYISQKKWLRRGRVKTG